MARAKKIVNSSKTSSKISVGKPNSKLKKESIKHQPIELNTPIIEDNNLSNPTHELNNKSKKATIKKASNKSTDRKKTAVKKKKPKESTSIEDVKLIETIVDSKPVEPIEVELLFTKKTFSQKILAIYYGLIKNITIRLTNIIDAIKKLFNSFFVGVRRVYRNFTAKKNREIIIVDGNIENSHIAEINKQHHDQPISATNFKPKNDKIGFMFIFGKALSFMIIIVIIVGMLVGTFGLGYINNLLADAPKTDIKKLKPLSSSIVYDSVGNQIAELGKEIRRNVTYEQLPQGVVDAFVSIEDSRFFVHQGFDLPRFVKAAISNLKSGDFSQGGSTFTMQLIKNSYFVEEGSGGAIKSVERKIQEIFLAIKTDALVDKKTILENYVNKNNYGGPYRGIQKAASYYFGKDIEDISLVEAALLAGVINLPNYYNPYLNLLAAKARTDEVLDLMFMHGYINENDLMMAKAIKIENLLVQETVYKKVIPFQAYIDTVIDDVIKFTGDDPYEIPMKIYTAMDMVSQTTIENIQANKYKGINVAKQKGLDTATVAIENSTGAIVAIGAGRKYNGQRLFNFATQMKKQPGSSIKPIIDYALAFEHLGYNTGMVVHDYPINYPDSNVKVNNWNNSYMGAITLQKAISYSQNVPAIVTLRRVEKTIGVNAIVKYMNNIGFNWLTKQNYSTQLGIGGAAFQTSPLEMSSAYQMLFNYGLWIEPHTIRRIEFFEDDNKPDFIIAPKKIQALSPQAAYLAAYMLKAHVDSYISSTTIMLRKKYPVYGKTGTSDWGLDGRKYGLKGTKDTWMAACTTRYSMVTWVGFDTQIKGNNFKNSTKNYALHGRINRKMLNALNTGKKTNPKIYKRPAGIVGVTVSRGFFPFVQPFGSFGATTGLAKKGATKFVAAPEIPPIPSVKGISVVSNQYDTYSITVAKAPKIQEVGENPDQFGINWLKQKPSNPMSAWGAFTYHVTISYFNGSISQASKSQNFNISLPKYSQGPIQVCAVYGFTKSKQTSPTVNCTTIEANPTPIIPPTP